MKGFKNDKLLLQKEFTASEILNFILWTIVIILPFVIKIDRLDTYYLPKAIFMWVVSVLLIIFSIKDIRLILRDINKLSLIFLVLVIISGILSENVRTSFFGANSRYEGVIMIGIYVLLFNLSSKYLKVNDMSIKILSVLFSIMCIYVIFQYYGIDPIPSDVFHQKSVGSTFGTLGNRNFMGTYI
ncbi:MAG: hypothetical protein ACRC2K_02225, partial [Clostridium sp.]